MSVENYQNIYSIADRHFLRNAYMNIRWNGINWKINMHNTNSTMMIKP